MEQGSETCGPGTQVGSPRRPGEVQTKKRQSQGRGPDRKCQDKEEAAAATTKKKKKKRSRKRPKKKADGAAGENADADKKEDKMDVAVETNRQEERRGSGDGGGEVPAQTQSRKRKGTHNRFTQTPGVVQSHKETQTPHVQPEDAVQAPPTQRSPENKPPDAVEAPPTQRSPENKPQDAEEAPPTKQTPENKPQDAEEAPPTKQTPENKPQDAEEAPPTKRTPENKPQDAEEAPPTKQIPHNKNLDQVPKESDPDPGDGTRETRPRTSTGSSSLGGTAPRFTFHVYAALDEKFHFDPRHDALVLLCGDLRFPLEDAHLVGETKEDRLVEASLSVDESEVIRGQTLLYRYGVKKKKKNETQEVAERSLRIPLDPRVKELHLYEGLISRPEAKGWLKASLGVIGLGRSRGEELKEGWQAAASSLLKRILGRWSPADTQSTNRLCHDLQHFSETLGSAHLRVIYPDESQPTRIQTSELISQSLAQLLVPGGVSGPLALGLSVFVVSRCCCVELEVKGWAELCVLVTSETALQKESLDEARALFPNLPHTVLGLINHCAECLVAEVVLLVPLLLRLRQPVAAAARVGPTVDEEAWSGLGGVAFVTFRERLELHSEKRRKLMALMRSRGSLAEETPLLAVSWACLVPSKDLPEYSELSGTPVEHLIQALMYRLRGTGGRDILEHAQKATSHILQKLEEDKGRMAERGNAEAAFLSGVCVASVACGLVQQPRWFQAAVLALRLALKLAESLLSSPGKEPEAAEQHICQQLDPLQQKICRLRDELLRKSRNATPNSVISPQEIQMWDSLFSAQCSVGDVSSRWTRGLAADLTRRISSTREESLVWTCCLEPSAAAVRRGHAALRTCFTEMCQSAISSICQRGQAGDLLRELRPRVKEIPEAVLSAVVVQSAALFSDPAARLLDPQSAVGVLLLDGDWGSTGLDAGAARVLLGCVEDVQALVESLLEGHVPVGHLQSCLKDRPQFKRLYQQYERHSARGRVPFATALLDQREKDLNAFLQRREQMETLAKMVAKVKESLAVPEMRPLEEQLAADLQTVTLNQLVLVPAFDSEGRLKTTAPLQVLWFSTSMNVLKMSSEMVQLHHSSLVLGSWVKGAAALAAGRQPPVTVTLAQVCAYLWKPLLAEFIALSEGMADGSVTLERLDRVLADCGERGDGTATAKELRLMSAVLSESGLGAGEENWQEARLRQILEYSQLLEAAAAASVILDIAITSRLSGDFSDIDSLIQLEDQTFKQQALRSLSQDLFQAGHLLSSVTRQQVVCLRQFLSSQPLVSWVRSNLPNMSDVQAYVELASISAGENDTEMDQVACFHDAVMGYAQLLYSLGPGADFPEFMRCARHVWDALGRDEKLPDKLRESSRLLSWLKALEETHGSVEQSSLSLASSINAHGVYHVGWSDENTQRRCLQNMVRLTVTSSGEDKSLGLEELLELRNKLMLMSSRGDLGQEQVHRFTQVFEGVQRIGAVLLQMQTSGNVLFRRWGATVRCRPPCVTVHFLSARSRQSMEGELVQQLQDLAVFMESCHSGWSLLVREWRLQFGLLNHYSAEQLVYLSFWIRRVCEEHSPLLPELRHLLFPIKPGCTLADLTVATSAASEHAESPYPESEEEPDASGDLMQFSSEDEDAEAELDGARALNALESLWRRFRTKASQCLPEYLTVPHLARLLACLSETSQRLPFRNLPPTLQEGKPNLVLCPCSEVFTTVLSFYAESPEQPLPSADEVLVCGEDTAAEEVEIFFRRALGQAPERSGRKIYCLVNPGLLGYDVGVASGDLFESLQRSADPRYRLAIVGPVVHQHRYVPSFFSSDRVQRVAGPRSTTAAQYLQHHFTQSTGLLASPVDLAVRVVSSSCPAVGKSLYVDRLFEKVQQEHPRAKRIRIRLIEPRVDVDSLVRILSEKLASHRKHDPVLLHIDTAGVGSGLEELLFCLLVLGCLSDSHGKLWRRNQTHFIVVEVLNPHASRQDRQAETRLGLLDILPTVHCRPPKEVKKLLENPQQTQDPLMDQQEFCSEAIQRPYQYLKRHHNNQNLDQFSYQEGSWQGDPMDCLHFFLLSCGMSDPSWAELKNFSWFLNVQLKDCENSVFCDPQFLAGQLPGFKGFIVKFMILMARDFASPSLNTAEDQDLLSRLTIRKRWENESHPYIFFNADRFSMSFLGFNVQMWRNTLCAVHPRSIKVLIENVMSQKLFQDLERQGISLTEDFDQLSRRNKIKRVSLVVGATRVIKDPNFDPDPTYELTADNVMKMLAINMRFRCGIPVVIMGETGCGKTRLVRFLCALQREERAVVNMVLVKVHGGTTAKMIYRKVEEAQLLAEKNRREHRLDTVLFLDEANTTEAIYAIKEILCDRSVRGEPLRADSGLKIIAACNPYRKHSAEMVERLERAGLGYRVKADETEERLGKVPLRQLVYRVQPLPPSMASLVWDFGQLSDSTELAYIRQIVQKTVADHGLPAACRDVITKVLAASQAYMRSRGNECSFVSLRDVERSMKVLVWFHQHSRWLFNNRPNVIENHKTLRCLVLAAGVCYYPSLVAKQEYLAVICRCFPSPLCSAAALQEEISSCQDFFLQNIQTRETIAKNEALMENVFLMVVCIELRIPLFLVGKPGSSKSLAKTVVCDAMQGPNSHCELFRNLKQVHMVSFQCSPHSSSEGIIGTFRNCARFQKDKNTEEYVSVVVLDEIGLAEDSPQMPLKTLHPLLEDGCIDTNEPDPHMKVGFVGISNWALDPAKMNRGIFVSRLDPSEEELVKTAKGICSSSNQILQKISHLFEPLAKAFLSICGETSKNQFFGLRDYYSLVKMLFATVKSTDQEPDAGQLVEAILCNFSGQPQDFDPVVFFQELLQKKLTDIPRPSTLGMVKKNLDLDTEQESRYLLLLTTNNAALHILQQKIFSRGGNTQPEIVFGSGFPKDQEYAQICRNVNRVKTCMETGRTVVLLNMQNLYESLYDALNQYYVYLGAQRYVDLGLGSHRVKCRVHTNFRLVVVEDQIKVYKQFPVPLINRLEKHRLDRSTDLEPWQQRVLDRLKEWVQLLSGEATRDFKPSDIFVGFHDDACAGALLQALEKRALKKESPEEEVKETMETLEAGSNEKAEEADRPLTMEPETESVQKNEDDDENKVEDEEEEVLDSAKGLLLDCATPDAVVRLRFSDLSNQEREKLQTLYFQHQNHGSLRDLLQHGLSRTQGAQRFLEITTFSSLLTGSDAKVLARALGLQAPAVVLLSLHQFDTEVSFCNALRGFLQDADLSSKVLVIQMDLEESGCSAALVASAKYCTMNHLGSPGDGSCRVIFIAKVSRIPGQSPYIGFQGGAWRSVHMDDLRDSEDMSLNLSVFCGTLVSNLLHPAASEEQREFGDATKDGQNQPDGAQLHSLSLVRSCLQKAVALLRDPGHVAPRSMKRMDVLLRLLGAEQGHVGAHFQRTLLSRLAEAVAQREERMILPTEWVSREAKKRAALQEGGTLRRTLWRCLQSAVVPVLAGTLETLDAFGNLDLLGDPTLSPGLLTLWLDVMADSHIIPLAPPQNPGETEREVLVQPCAVLDGAEQPCSAPFSWVVRLHLESLWEESEFMPVSQEDGSERILRLVSSFRSSRLDGLLRKLSHEERWDFADRFLRDFLLLSMKIQRERELRALTRATKGCVAQLQRSLGADPDPSPAWIVAAAKHFGPRLDNLHLVLLLQPQVAADVLQQGSEVEPEEMVDDVVVLGACVEHIKLLGVSSLPECRVFVRRMELLQPCVDGALGQKHSALYSPSCLQNLDSIRSLWNGMLLVASFIQRVVFEGPADDARWNELALKHCNLHLKLMQESPDICSVDTLQQLIRILNSLHDDFLSRDLREALGQHAALRTSCNSFFLEVVSRFCLTEGRSPGEGLVELLFSLLVSANGDVYKTRELSPFLECVDNSPVVRSVLPKLLLQSSFEQAKSHIQIYLRNLEENLVDPEDHTELYLLFVNCFQDSLLCSQARDTDVEQQRRAEVLFLGRVARKQVPQCREQPAEFLLNLARLRMCLSTAAGLLEKAAGAGGLEDLEAEYLRQVRAVCEYQGNDWYRVYLLRAVNRLCGTGFLLSQMQRPDWTWMFPGDVVERQKQMGQHVDQFLCCGTPYSAMRDAVSRVLLENRADSFRAQLKELRGSKISVVALALFRNVTCRHRSADPSMHPSRQEKATAKQLLPDISSADLRTFCSSLLENQIGGRGSRLGVHAGLSPQRHIVLELLVHLDSLLQGGNAFLAPLRQVAFQPQNATNSFLPTMPDDRTAEARGWLSGEKNLVMYTCSNGHACFVGECGKPWVVSKCPDCGLPVGGENHRPVGGFSQSTDLTDRTRTGHLLGEAGRRSEAPERKMSCAQSGVLRLLTHLAMLQGTSTDQRGVEDMIHPRPRDGVSFLWSHLEKDLAVLGQTLNLNPEDTAVTVHLVLSVCAEADQGSSQATLDLSTRQGREMWENLMREGAISPVLKSLQQRLAETRQRMGADAGLAHGPLMALLHGDPGTTMPSGCPTNRSSFWTLPDILTLERFSQLVGEAPELEDLPLLKLFLRKVNCVRQLHHLPELAALQSDLLRVFPVTPDSSQTISQMLRQIPAGYGRKTLLERVERFFKVWNCLRAEVSNNSADLGVDVALCEEELTAESSGQFLTPARHGAGSCLRTLVDFLSETHNALVREARGLSPREDGGLDSGRSVPLDRISETQLSRCDPERELLPLVLSHRQHTLRKGQATHSDFQLGAVQTQLARRFLSGKPLVVADTSRFLNRRLQDFSVVLAEVRGKIPQEALKGSACAAATAALGSYTDACDAVSLLEVGLRFLGKMGGDGGVRLASYLADSLQMRPQISGTVAKGLGESRLAHAVFTWQLLTSWKSELMLNRKQDPFPKVPSEFRRRLTEADRRGLKVFLAHTDVEAFCLELHEILLLKTEQGDDSYGPHWDLADTLEIHLERKELPPLPGLQELPRDITLAQGAHAWQEAVEFKRR